MHVVWLLAICGISVTSQSENGFQYINTDAFSLKDTCEMCYGYDCTSINEARCEYYKEANEILEEDDEYEKEKNEITNEVDNILGEYIDIASSTPRYKECIPLISQYTDCNKDNICNGCKVCNCDISGVWSCTNKEECHSAPLLVMDHRALVLAMENLNEFKKFHLDKTEKSINIMNDGININTPEDIVKWMYGVKKIDLDLEGRNATEKAALKNNTDSTSGLGYVDNDNTHLDFFENQNLKPKRLEKRNATLVTNESYINVNATIDNHTAKDKDLHNTVFFPLHNIVNEKEKELNKLISIKENLLSYLKSHMNISFENNTTTSKNVENSSLYLYQFDVLPAIDFRRFNPIKLEDYLKKLKRDIYEVMHDIAKIQRLSNSSKMPQDLKMLIKAMRNYVNKENKRKKLKQSEIIINLRRKLDKDRDDEDEYPINTINNILEVLDKDTPTADALAPLSQNTRKILKRVVKHFAVEDPASIVSNVFDPENNVENFLNSVGVKWQNMTLGIGKNEISERLYSLKLFELVLSKDVTTMQKTIEIIEFAQTRRMNVIDHFVGERITSKIGNDLRKINNRVKQILQFQTIGKKEVISSTGQTLTSTDINKTKIKSFLQRIRRLMKNSKRDIKDLLHKVKKSNVMKRIGKKKMDEMTYKKFSEYEETMQRWKENLNVVTRRKRNDGYFQKFLNRMKNIIPSYLRGKVKPAVKKKINKSETLRSKHQNKVKNIKKNIISTTPVIKLSTKRKHKGKRKHNHNKNVQQSINTTQV